MKRYKIKKIKQTDKAALQKAGVADKRIAELMSDVPKMASAKKDDYKSNLEREFARVLEVWKRQETIDWWGYEVFKICVGAASKNTKRKAWYMPDFISVKRMVSWANVTIYEIKGREWPGDRHKIKTAAMLYPYFKWVMVKKVDGRFKCEEFGE